MVLSDRTGPAEDTAPTPVSKDARSRLLRKRETQRKYDEKRRGRKRADRHPDQPSEDRPPVITPSLAGLTILIVEGMFVPGMGEQARFNPTERKLIEPALERMLARLNPADAGRMSALMDPLFLGCGLVLWWMRVGRAPLAPQGVVPTPIRPPAPSGGTPTAASPPPPPGPPPPSDSGTNGASGNPDIFAAWR